MPTPMTPEDAALLVCCALVGVAVAAGMFLGVTRRYAPKAGAR